MKKRILKVGAALICVLLVLYASGGVLAQPERQEPEEDQFVGFQLVYEEAHGLINMSDPDWEKKLEDSPAEDRSQWVEYGSESLELEGIGSVVFPREILIGQYDEASGRYLFPGKEGWNCFLAVMELESGGQCYTGYYDLANVGIKVGDEESLSGTVYFGPPLDDSDWKAEDYALHAYRVYQMSNGTVYLDGSGNSYSCAGGVSFSEKIETTETVDGQAQGTSFEVTVDVEEVPRLEAVTVKWFDGADQMLSAQTLTPEEIGDGLTLPAPDGAAWALVEEAGRTGDMIRNVYTLGEAEEPTHQLVLLDDQGLGRVVYLTLGEAPSRGL